MWKPRSPVVLQLGGGELLPLAGACVQVEHGRVWVTRAGDLDDHFLHAGQAMLLERGACALVGADAPARLRVAPRGGGLRALLRAWRRRRAAAAPPWPPVAWDIDGLASAGARCRSLTPSR